MRNVACIAAVAGSLAVALVRGAEPIVFTDATAAAGIKFVHNHGGFGKKYLPETIGSGVVFFDMDGDGWQDVFLVNAKSLNPQPSAAKRGPSLSALYRNVNGVFTDATRGSGLDVELYGIGATSADFDNDGKIDLYLTHSAATGSSGTWAAAGSRM
jgi:enediyne biosynthesis protein E4